MIMFELIGVSLKASKFKRVYKPNVTNITRYQIEVSELEASYVDEIWIHHMYGSETCNVVNNHCK